MAQDAFEEIAETFEFLDDWEDRYRHVIELGRAMPELDEALRVPATKVTGCASQVWIVPRLEGAADGSERHPEAHCCKCIPPRSARCDDSRAAR